MPTTQTSRRDFLKLSALSLGALATQAMGDPPGPGYRFPRAQARIAQPVINIYSQPDFASQRTGRLIKDQLVDILGEVRSPAGPQRNPYWYQIDSGYIHRGRVQRVVRLPPNRILSSIPAGGILGEITFPYVDSQRWVRGAGWQRLYRLYYLTVHWVTAIDTGPDGKPWYRLHDHLMSADYHVPAACIRPVEPDEYSPLSPDVPAEDKHIIVSVSDQTLTAYEGDRPVYQVLVSTGIPTPNLPEGEIPTETPLGYFWIQTKMPARHMGDGRLTADPEAYELPGIPWVSFFHKEGVAFHGTYWHTNFGYQMSHGCVNLPNRDAKWLFRWSHPVYRGEDYFVRERGTLVEIRE